MKYTVTVDGEIFEIEFQPGGRAWVNQRPYRVDLKHVGGQYSLLMNHRSYEIHVGETEEDACRVTVGGRPFRARLQRGHRGNGRAAGEMPLKDGASRETRCPLADIEMRAPLPGLVLETQVIEGDYVEEQEVVLVLESMKMNLELRAPRAGVVQKLRTSSGQHVAQDEVLAVISPNGASVPHDD